MKFTSLLIASIPAIASASKSVLLDDTNWVEETVTKKLMFVKFFAPWCGHCKAMAADWEQLAEVMAEELPEILVADVDCSGDTSEKVCAAHQIEGFPTLKYGDPDFLEIYSGSNEFEELYVFATSPNLKASCSPKHLDECTEEEKVKLEEILAMTIDELKAAVKALNSKFEEMEAKFDASTDVLEQEYMMMTEEKEIKEKMAMNESNYKLIKSIMKMRNATASAGKDEL